MRERSKSMIERINTQGQINRQPNNKKSFKGAETAVLSGLRGLSNSPALGACAVDLCSMVIPRTVVETKNRGKESGFETFFREVSSCVIHACVGLIGLGASTALSKRFNENYGVKAQSIFASGETMNNLATRWNNIGDSLNGTYKRVSKNELLKKQTQKYFEDFLGNIKGLNGTEWRGISAGAKNEIADNMLNLVEINSQIPSLTGIEKDRAIQKVKDLKQIVTTKIIKDTGAQASFKLADVAVNAGQNGSEVAATVAKGVSSSLSELVDNAIGLGNSFRKVGDISITNVGDKKSVRVLNDRINNFVKDLSKNKTKATLIGLGICAVLCMGVQPLNRYLTKKRTGKDGFVGVDNNNNNAQDTKKSNAYKPLKLLSGIAFPLAAIRSIGKPADLITNVQFNSKVPTINQFKFLYGLTIGSRLLSSRDGNELRESLIKDTLGFTNWLILGGMVSKLTARAIGGKDLINNPLAQEGKKGLKYGLKWLAKASVKTFDEVLVPNTSSVVYRDKAKTFAEMLKTAAPDVKSKIAKVAFSQVAGYLYSGIVLGVGISKLNIFITKKLNAKKTQQNNQNTNTQPQETISAPKDNYKGNLLDKYRGNLLDKYKK